MKGIRNPDLEFTHYFPFTFITLNCWKTKIIMIKALVFIVMLINFFTGYEQSFAAEEKKIFIVASYEKEHVCGNPQEQGAIKGLSKEGWFEGMNLKVARYYMDTKKKNITPELMKKEANVALQHIQAFEPNIVITLDDNAFREVGLPLASHDSISVVFSGMNGQPETYNKKIHFMDSRDKPGSNITGVYEKLYVVRSLKVLAAAIPAINGKKVTAITDYTPTGNAITKQFDLELHDKPTNIAWELLRVKNWEQYTSYISQINKDNNIAAIYPVALSLKDAKGHIYTAPDIFKWTIANSKKPEMALNYFFSKIGLFGGAAVDFQRMGFVAGRMAGQILNGTRAGTLPIVDAPDYAIVFNLKRAKELEISIPDSLLTAADQIFQ